jgi:hypothetical protein
MGCDSVITINLTINNADTSVSVSGSTLNALANGAAYQWIDCGSMQPLNGETGQSLAAPANGSYAVIVTENGCTDTSSCYTILNVGQPVLNNRPCCNAFPNPSSAAITIETGATEKDAILVIYNQYGVIQKTFSCLNRTRFSIEKKDFGAGIYYYKLYSGKSVSSGKLVFLD